VPIVRANVIRPLDRSGVDPSGYAHTSGFEMSSSTKNRAFWNSTSDAYQASHGTVLRKRALAWGVWRIPESTLRILGDVEGRRVLELGCGAAQWTLALLERGAHAIGVDLSDQQLMHARAAAQSGSIRPTLVQGDAEQLPFRSEMFDIVFCDHGAIVFAPPETTVAEASRVLRPGGLCALCMSTPVRDICFDATADSVTPRLSANYFELSKMESPSNISFRTGHGSGSFATMGLSWKILSSFKRHLTRRPHTRTLYRCPGPGAGRRSTFGNFERSLDRSRRPE